MDPHKNTREDFSRQMATMQVPADAHKDWKSTVIVLKAIHYKLAFHDAMKPNIHQTYMTPANSKNRVYFMWDFVGRTLSILTNTDPWLSKNMSRQEKEAWEDGFGRACFASQLMLDTKPGTLNMMIEHTNPEEKGKHPEFGEEILALARKFSGKKKAT